MNSQRSTLHTKTIHPMAYADGCLFFARALLHLAHFVFKRHEDDNGTHRAQAVQIPPCCARLRA